MSGDLTVCQALCCFLDHWTVLLHGQHLLLHLHGLHHSDLPQPEQGIPLLEETPHLQGLLRQGDQALALGSLWFMPFSCLHPPVANISLWTRERMLCSWKSLFFLLPEPPEMMPSSLCPAAGGSSLQLRPAAGHGLTTDALHVTGGSDLPGDGWVTVLLQLTLSCPMVRGPQCAFQDASPYVSMCLLVLPESHCASQDTPYSSGCLSVQCRSLRLPFGAAQEPLCALLFAPKPPLHLWCPQHSQSAIQ